MIDIIPVAVPQKKIKLLSADPAFIEKLPAVDSKISFLPFLNFLKEKISTTSGTKADFYQYLIRKFEAEPALLQQVVNVQILGDHEELLELLSSAIFPMVSEEEKNNFTLSAPYQFNIFSYSESF